ncbi:MAG: hypothetical protein KC487_10585 [Anaerolineae bacterium]|nr:hypothetical protein [Anaerolineae bacterium]
MGESWGVQVKSGGYYGVVAASERQILFLQLDGLALRPRLAWPFQVCCHDVALHNLSIIVALDLDALGRHLEHRGWNRIRVVAAGYLLPPDDLVAGLKNNA